MSSGCLLSFPNREFVGDNWLLFITRAVFSLKLFKVVTDKRVLKRLSGKSGTTRMKFL